MHCKVKLQHSAPAAQSNDDAKGAVSLHDVHQYDSYVRTIPCTVTLRTNWKHHCGTSEECGTSFRLEFAMVFDVLIEAVFRSIKIFAKYLKGTLNLFTALFFSGISILVLLRDMAYIFDRLSSLIN